MLGYVRTQPSELRMREYEAYRALYCGLCRHMGKCTGQCSRLSLSYDFVFLALVRASLQKEQPTFVNARCLLHPLHRRKMLKNSPVLRYCADASALLTYHKCRDDVADERGLHRLVARFAKSFFSSAYRRAKKRHPKLDARIFEQMEALRLYEADDTLPPSADAPAEIFGKLMEAVFCEDLEGSDARIAAQIGRSIGRWIYLTDAADDFWKDVNSGSFNPYCRLFGSTPTAEDWQMAEMALTNLLADAERAFLLIDDYPIPEYKELLCNAMYLGLPGTAKKILQHNAKGNQNNHENSL